MEMTIPAPHTEQGGNPGDGGIGWAATAVAPTNANNTLIIIVIIIIIKLFCVVLEQSNLVSS